MKLSTDAIDDAGFFDPRYTCDVDNSSPELRWSDPPVGTAGFALICEDPDARSGTFSHWVVYHVPPAIHHLPAGIPPQDSLPNGIRQGVNSAGKLGYMGPCPPRGDSAHRYVFRLFALSAMPTLEPRATREQLLAAMQGSTLAVAEIQGRYQRMVERAG